MQRRVHRHGPDTAGHAGHSARHDSLTRSELTRKLNEVITLKANLARRMQRVEDYLEQPLETDDEECLVTNGLKVSGESAASVHPAVFLMHCRARI